MHNGVAAYQQVQSDNIRNYFRQMSVFYGAPAAAHIVMLENIARWFSFMVAVTVAVGLSLHASGLVLARRERMAPAPGTLKIGRRFSRSGGLNLVYTCAFHCPKPGYLLSPPIAPRAPSWRRGTERLLARFSASQAGRSRWAWP